MQDNTAKASKERAILDRLASSNLSSTDYSLWLSTKAHHRFMAHKGKRLIAFRMSGSKAIVIDSLECKGISFSFEAGFSSIWRVRSTGAHVTVGVTPVQIADGCFLNHTIISGVEYVEYKPNQFGSMVSMAYKTPHNPLTVRNDSCVYLMEEAAFFRTYPD